MNNSNKSFESLLTKEMQIRNYSGRTIKTYCSLLSNYELIVQKPLREVTTEDFKSRLHYLIKEKGASTVTIRSTTSCPPDSLPLSLRQKSYVKKQTQSRRLVFADWGMWGIRFGDPGVLSTRIYLFFELLLLAQALPLFPRAKICAIAYHRQFNWGKYFRLRGSLSQRGNASFRRAGWFGRVVTTASTFLAGCLPWVNRTGIIFLPEIAICAKALIPFAGWFARRWVATP